MHARAGCLNGGRGLGKALCCCCDEGNCLQMPARPLLSLCPLGSPTSSTSHAWFSTPSAFSPAGGRQAGPALRRRQPARRQRALHRHAADVHPVHTGGAGADGSGTRQVHGQDRPGASGWLPSTASGHRMRPRLPACCRGSSLQHTPNPLNTPPTAPACRSSARLRGASLQRSSPPP